MDREDRIEETKDQLARRRAWLDQIEKRFEDQYPSMSPRINALRLEDIEAWKFNLAINEWELEEFIKSEEEEE